MLQQAKADWEILRSRPPQEPQMEPEQEADLGDLEEELKARALAELDEQELQQDCEQNAAKESAGRAVSRGEGSANNAVTSPTEDEDLATEVDKEREVMRRDFEEVEPAIGKRRSAGADSSSHVDSTLLAQRQASR